MAKTQPTALIWPEAQASEARRRIAILVSAAHAITAIGYESQREFRDPTINGSIRNAVDELLGQASGQNALLARLGQRIEEIPTLDEVLEEQRPAVYESTKGVVVTEIDHSVTRVRSVDEITAALQAGVTAASPWPFPTGGVKPASALDPRLDMRRIGDTSLDTHRQPDAAFDTHKGV